ncbi:Fatty acid hydroxylase domain-containing protein [Balamuthia mandrillaris]
MKEETSWLPPVREDKEHGQQYYTVQDAMQLSPQAYEEWVYSSKTPKVDEVRLYPDSRFWNGVMTKSPPFLPLLFWPPVILWMVGLPLEGAKVMAVVVGLMLWFPVEYLFHRFLFHIPVTSPFTRKFHFMLHGIHHVAPKDLWHVFSPPHEVAVQIIAVWTFFWALGVPEPTSVCAGILLNYMRYDLVHYCCHAYSVESLGKVRPAFLGRYLQRCKVHHMTHHFVNPRNHYTISFVTSLVD